MLYSFGQYYLQYFPEKAAAFLEYLWYLTTYASEFTVQGLLKLDNELRRLYVLNPEWNWEQSRYEISCITDHHIRERNNFQNIQSNQQSACKSSRGFGGRGRGSFRGRSTSSPQVPSASQQSALALERCMNYNKGWCRLGNKCYRQHICYSCGDKNHKLFTCTQVLASNNSN